MATRPQVKIAVKISDYAGISVLASQVSTAMAADMADFPSPSPTLMTLNSDIATLNQALLDWGPVGNRGSHAQLVALRAAVKQVYNDLLLLAAYVQNLVDLSAPYVDQAAFIVLSGFGVKNSPSPQGVLAAPEDLRQIFSPTVDIYAPRIDWKKPLGVTSQGNVKSYEVIRSAINSINAGSIIANPTNTTWTDNTAVAGTMYYYFVRGTNAAGRGVPTASLLVSVPN